MRCPFVVHLYKDTIALTTLNKYKLAFQHEEDSWEQYVLRMSLHFGQDPLIGKVRAELWLQERMDARNNFRTEYKKWMEEAYKEDVEEVFNWWVFKGSGSVVDWNDKRARIEGAWEESQKKRRRYD